MESFIIEDVISKLEQRFPAYIFEQADEHHVLVKKGEDQIFFLTIFSSGIMVEYRAGEQFELCPLAKSIGDVIATMEKPLSYDRYDRYD